MIINLIIIIIVDHIHDHQQLMRIDIYKQKNSVATETTEGKMRKEETGRLQIKSD